MLVGQQHEFLASGPPVDPRINQATVFSCGAALALVSWDAILTLGDEADYIWSGSGRAHVKWIYLFSRWFGLLNQIGIQIWHYFIAAHPPVPASTCETLFIVEAVTIPLLQSCLNAVLILQIWAVYQRRHRYIAVAFAIVFFEVILSLLAQALSVQRSSVDGTCMILHTPPTTTCLGIGMVVSQAVLLFLTYRGRVFLRPVARRSKLMTVVVRDGVLVFGVVIGMVLTACLYLLFDEVVINVFTPWVPVVPSVVTPRMILNMQLAARAEPTETTLEFTTDLGAMPNNEIQLSSMHEVSAIHEQRR